MAQLDINGLEAVVEQRRSFVGRSNVSTSVAGNEESRKPVLTVDERRIKRHEPATGPQRVQCEIERLVRLVVVHVVQHPNG